MNTEFSRAISDPRSGRPNIVLILVDDLGWRDLGCYGSTFYETPRIDDLASSGLLYRNAYASAPVCSPARASIMSGKYPARVGVTQYIGGHSVGALSDVPYFGELPKNEFSLARALSAGGYDTWHVGKWHLGPRACWPDEHGFDINIGGCEMGSPSTYFSPYSISTLEDGPAGEYLTDRLTDEAVSLISGSGDRPFFLNLWHYAVHIPIEVPLDLHSKYSKKAESLGLSGDEILPGEEMPTWHLDGERVKRRLVQSDAGYAAMVENLDSNVGRIVDALEARGKLADTVIVLTSDNGGLATAEGSPTTNAPLAEGKGWMKDGGVRVPLVVSWPGRVNSGVTDSVTTSPDLYPTLLEVAGLPARPLQHVDGKDISKEWLGEATDRGPVYWHYPHYSNQGGRPGAAVRDGALKLIRYYETGEQELYDLSQDEGETEDLSVSRASEVVRLGGMLDEWIASVGALLPKPNPYLRSFEPAAADG